MFLKAITIVYLVFNWPIEAKMKPVARVDAFPEKTIELAVFLDQYLYHYWLSIYRSPATLRDFIESYLSALLHSLNLIYAHPTLEEVPIVFELTHSQIFWRGDPTNIVYNSREAAPSYLEHFCAFANKENWSGDKWDHALLLTGIDLKFPNGTNYAVAGISWDNSMCNQTYSCSVVEGKTFQSVMTAAHEIGHSLGIEHDGVKYNSKCPSRGFIMGHAGGDGVVAWSPCSKNNLKAFLITAPSVLSNQVACLDQAANGRSSRVLDRATTRRRNKLMNELPGHMFTLEDQCNLGGAGGIWHPSLIRIHIRNTCSMLHCVNNVTKEVVPFHPALDGSYCGQNKICKYGKCIRVERESRSYRRYS